MSAEDNQQHKSSRSMSRVLIRIRYDMEMNFSVWVTVTKRALADACKWASEVGDSEQRIGSIYG